MENKPENKPTIWAWGGPKGVDDDTKELLLKSIREDKKSRFGWSWEPDHYLRGEKWTDQHSKQLFLLQIKEGDWIVHINLPEYNRCIAVRVVSKYKFDDGIPSDQQTDFRHYFDVERVIEFDRNALEVLPTVNLRPRQRYHRIYAVADFLKSIDNLQKGTVELSEGESRGEYHLKEKIKEEKPLSQISYLIHKTHPGKDLEKFLAKVFRNIPNVESVIENGSGGTDFGADLIVDINTSLWDFNINRNRIIVQVKSYEGIHEKLEAVDQIRQGIEKIEGTTAGIIVTTAEGSEDLKKKVEDVSTEMDVPIFLLDSEDLAKFVIKYAPEMIDLNP